MLIDEHGQKITRPALRPMTTQQQRNPYQWGNQNPDEIVTQRGYAYYREMLRNPYIAAAIDTRVRAVVGRWEGATPHTPKTTRDREFRGQVLSNGRERGAEAKALEFVRLNLDEWLVNGWSQALSQVLHGAIVNGFSVAELIWGFRDFAKRPYGGHWYLKDVQAAMPDYFQFDSTGQLWMSPSYLTYDATIPCPAYRFVMATHGQQCGNRYGESLLRSLSQIEWYERNAWAFWLSFTERFGSPTLLGKVTPDAGDAVRNALLEILRQMKNETGLVIDTDQEVTLLESTRSGEAGYQALIELCHKLYAICITGNALTLAPDKTGSYAMATATTAPIREDILYADCELLDRVMSYQPLYYLAAMNFGEIEHYPYQRMLPPKVKELTDQDLLHRAQRDEILQRMGMPMTAGYLSETYMIPSDSDPARIVTPLLIGGASTSSQVSNPSPEPFAGNPYDTVSSPVFWHDEDLRRAAAEGMRIFEIAEKPTWERLTPSQQAATFTVSQVLTLGAVDEIRWLFADALQDGLTANEMLVRYRDYAKTHPDGAGVPESFLQVSYTLWTGRALERAANSVAAERGWVGWKYMTQDDPRVRPTHAAMHGVMRPLNDAVWKIWTPPVDMGCRCYRVPVTAEDAHRQGWTHQLPQVTP